MQPKEVGSGEVGKTHPGSPEGFGQRLNSLWGPLDHFLVGNLLGGFLTPLGLFTFSPRNYTESYAHGSRAATWGSTVPIKQVYDKAGTIKFALGDSPFDTWMSWDYVILFIEHSNQAATSVMVTSVQALPWAQFEGLHGMYILVFHEQYCVKDPLLQYPKIRAEMSVRIT